VKPWRYPLVGKLAEHVVDSQVLTGNPLGDPHQRPVWVWTPPGYDADSDRRYPVIYRLQGFTGQVDMWANRPAFRPTPVEAADAAFAGSDVPPTILVYVDAWTSLGGSQFLDSPATGRYHTYLCDEIVPWVDATYRTLASGEHRAIVGHSSGGYGAMVTPMLRPDLFGAFATHAGDAVFELCYLPDVRSAARALRDRYEGSVERFVQAFREDPAPMQGPGHDGGLVNMYAMAACYAADADGTVNLPFDPADGRLRPDIWERFLAWDPVRMVASHADALRSMLGIWIDAGRSDEYYLDLGAEAFRRELGAVGVRPPRVKFELFEGKHGGVEWRYPLAIAWLAERIAG
jgi:S-formylglutathione hydrolase FrmB